MLVHVTLLETSYSTCFRKRPFFSGISSTCTLSLLNSSCRVWGSSSGFPGGACIRNCSDSRGSFTGGFAKSARQKGIKQSNRSWDDIAKGDLKYSVPSLRAPTVVQHHQESTRATPPPGGYATSHTFETSVPPSPLHPEAPLIISSQEAISTEQKNHRPNSCRDSARRLVFPVCPAPTTAGSAKMSEALAQHFWILPRTNHGSKENV